MDHLEFRQYCLFTERRLVAFKQCSRYYLETLVQAEFDKYTVAVVVLDEMVVVVDGNAVADENVVVVVVVAAAAVAVVEFQAQSVGCSLQS